MAKLTAAGEVFTALVVEVFRVNGLALEAGDALTESLGLSSARWQVLGVVDHEPAPVGEIARHEQQGRHGQGAATHEQRGC